MDYYLINEQVMMPNDCNKLLSYFYFYSLFYKNFQQFPKLSIKYIKIDQFGIYFNIDTIKLLEF